MAVAALTDETERTITQCKAISDLLTENGLLERGTRRARISALAGRPVLFPCMLTRDEAKRVIAGLEMRC
jgi:hypothetical protein